jgi:hypothetical protein
MAGLMCKTSDRTFRAGKYVAAPKGDIRADTETRKTIHAFMPGLRMEYGGADISCRSGGPAGIFSRLTCTSFGGMSLGSEPAHNSLSFPMFQIS